MPYTYSTVADVLGRVSQDTRLQLSATSAPGQTILIDYTNRVHQQMLRYSRWPFLRSNPQYFMTVKGQTDYWCGPTLSLPVGVVDTGLHLTDLDRVEKNSFRDLSNNNTMKAMDLQPLGGSVNYRSGQSRQGIPAQFWQDINNVNLVHIYPAPDNSNPFAPFPSTPYLTYATGGALASRTYYVRITFVDSNGGESQGSDISAELIIPASNLITVVTPTMYFNKSSDGVLYNKYNVYISLTEGTETLQNLAPIAVGTNWTEPTSGLITTGPSVPTTSTLQPLGGYVMQFRYYKARLTLQATTDTLQIPDNYLDILVHGVNALVWKFLGKDQDSMASFQTFTAGMTQMVWDKNQFPDTDYIRADAATYVNSQVLGIWPASF